MEIFILRLFVAACRLFDRLPRWNSIRWRASWHIPSRARYRHTHRKIYSTVFIIHPIKVYRVRGAGDAVSGLLNAREMKITPIGAQFPRDSVPAHRSGTPARRTASAKRFIRRWRYFIRVLVDVIYRGPYCARADRPERRIELCFFFFFYVPIIHRGNCPLSTTYTL